MILEWNDVSRYSQGETNREPHTWTAMAGDFRLTITNHHIYYPGKWVMHLSPGLIDTKPLDADTAEKAKAEAEAVASGVILKAAKALDLLGNTKQEN